jgi:signal transduction histidine kinase
MSVCAVSSVKAAGPSSWPQTIIEVPEHFRGALTMDGSIEAAVNESNATTLSEMLHQRSGDFQPINGHDFNLGFVRTSGWMRFAIRRSTNSVDPAQNVLLSLLPNMTNFIDVYVAADKPGLEAADFRKFQMGEHAPLLPTGFNGLDNILHLQLPLGETLVIYVRAANIDSTLNLSAALYSTEGYDERVTTSSLIFGVWLGGMAILIVVQLLFFCLDPRPLYGLLALYIFFTTMVYFAGLGLSRLFLFPSGGIGNDLFIGIADWLGLCTGALCVASILELRRRFPRLDLFYRLVAASGIVGVGLVLAGHNHWFTPVAGPSILAITTFAVIVATGDFWRSRRAEEGLKLAAFFLLWAGLLLTNGQRYGVVPLPNWVAKSYGTTSIIYFILLTGSLAVRLRRAEAASRDADHRAVEAASAAEAWANRLVVERTTELVDAKRVAENALQSELDAQKRQVRFMEVISHQYRTPLAVVRSNLESVKFTLPIDDTPNHQRLERAGQGIARLVEVLEVNLARSLLQGSSFNPSMTRLLIAEVLDEAILRARDLFPTADIQPVISSEFSVREIDADREMLVLALINLLENGIKFSTADTPYIAVDTHCEGDLAVISIRDFGIGIPADELHSIKALKIRGSNAAHIEGTGTGLSLVGRITAVHGGDFALSNAANGGVVAEIRLPIMSAASTNA